MTANGRVNQPGFLPQNAVSHRTIVFFHGALLELLAKMRVRRIVFCDQNQAGRILIKPVDDSRPPLAADAGKVVHVIKQRVHQRSVFVSGRRMHHHAAGFVDNGNIRILIENIKRNILRLYGRRPGMRNGQHDALPGLGLSGRAGFHLSIHAESALFHQGDNA